MSQAKVERRKYEKHNRKRLEKQRKMKFTLQCVATALVIGAIVAVPLSINYYKSIPKFVGDATLSAFIKNYVEENRPSDIPDFEAMQAEAEAQQEEAKKQQEATKELEEATNGQLEEVTADNVDEVLGTDDAEEDSEATEEDSQADAE